MGWGWPFSSTASDKGSAAPAAPATHATHATHATPATSATSAPLAPRPGQELPPGNDVLRAYQLELMRLERQNLEMLAKARQGRPEEARPDARTQSLPHAAQPPSPSPSLSALPSLSSSSSTTSTTMAALPPPPEPARTREENLRRSAKQLGLFLAGAGFLTASVLVSRRAVARKMVDSFPKFYQPSHYGPRPPPRGPAEKGDDQLVAIEALGLATLNVFSFGVMMSGGLMYAFDISNLDDLRRKARSKLYGTNGVVDHEAEQQVEEWIADVLSRRDQREDKAGSQARNG